MIHWSALSTSQTWKSYLQLPMQSAGKRLPLTTSFLARIQAEVTDKLSHLFAHAYLHFHTGSEEDWIRSIEQGRKPYLISHILNTLGPASIKPKISRYYIPFDGKFFHKVSPHVQYVWLDGYDRNLNHLIGNNWIEGKVDISNTSLQYAIVDLDRFAEDLEAVSWTARLDRKPKERARHKLAKRSNDLYSLSSSMNELVRETQLVLKPAMHFTEFSFCLMPLQS